MNTLFTLIALLLGTAQTSTARPYQLNGEALGMTLEQFKKNHSHADCQRRTEEMEYCHVYEGVSFAGVKATSDKSCKGSKSGDGRDYCLNQGIGAEFVDGKLASLSYGVAKGMAPIVIEALKKEYGKPDVGGSRSAEWSNSVSTLVVMSLQTRKRDGTIVDIATFITVTLKNANAFKDIP